MDHPAVFRSHPWRISYRTSALHPDGRAVDILHDFYIPVLQRAVTYDRVAGYFSSSSLAAASQGFSAFVGRRGKARFIVGADLASDDVTAILEGDAKRLARRLEESAFGEESVWPPAVARGVELLGWMVAHDHLDIRVGFRVHRETGRPLPINSAADGYVHEKWALFIDAAGDKIHVSGSLNESRTALVINAENLDLHCAWRNEENAQRVVAAEASFAALWADRHPAFRVLTLQEAIRRRLIQYGERCRCPREIDDTGAMHPIPTGPGALKRLRFHLIKDAPHLPRGRYVGMETAPVEPWPHQRVVARRIVEQWPGSQLLCDEVGLGKTIEAGLAIRSLVLSGLAHKVLIAAPASLTQQWQRELSDKFLLSFARVLSGPGVRHEVLSPQPERFNSRNLFDPDLLILSTGLLSRKERRQGLPNYDLALVDEAHYARRRNPTRGLRARPDYGHLYTAIRDDLRPRARCLLLATATPMQLHPVEVADLLRLMPRVGPFQFDAGLMLNYYELVGKLRRQETPNPNEWAFLTAVIRDLKFLDPFFWHYLETATLDDRGKRVLENWLGRGRIPHRTDYRLLNRLLFAAGPLSRVMLRHTRALLEVYSREGKLGARLARRQVLPIPPIRFTEQEARAYHQLETYCKGLADIMARNADDTAQRAAVGFYLSFLRLRFASSLYAIRETLRRRRERVRWTLEHQDFTLETSEFDENDFLLGEAEEDEPEAVSAILRFRTPEDLHWEQDQLDTMLATLDDLSETSSKTQHLFQVLDQRRLDGERIRQTVIFTRFYDTLQDLLRRLRTVRWNLRLGTYSGSGGRWFDPAVERLMEAPREAIKRRFLRGEIDLLLCTDAAAEGLNLQTADLLVNFDLPWNPMKVEQRIGRIDRIGQRHDLVQVLNLCYLGSAEEEVYGRLLQRLEIVGAIVGSQQLSLLPVTAKDFEDLAQGELDAETLAIQAEQRAREAREQIERMEIPAGELYQIYTRAEQTAPVHKSPVTLDHIRQGLIFSDWLAAQGCQVHRSDHGEWLALTIPDLAGTALTTSRALLETGLPAGEQTELHFASYGDSVFDRLLAGLTEFPLPDCVHRLTVIVNGIPVVGYAVCCRLSDGGHEIRLIDDYSQLEGLVLAEDRQPSQAEIRQLESLLRQRAETVYRQSRHMPDIETVNQNVAHNQQILNRLVIAELIKTRQRLRQMQPLFRDEAESIERMYGDDDNRRNPVRVNHLPENIIAAFSPRGLPFQPVLPPLEKEGYVDAPPILIRAALNSAWQITDVIKRRGRPLESEQVVERLLREVGK